MEIHIADRRVGPGHPVLIVAELSANHRQDYGEAEALVRAAKDAGADAVKLQTYLPDTMTIDSDRGSFQIRGGTSWDGRSLYELYRDAFTPWNWHARLQDLAHSLGLIFFSTAFDASSVDFLEELRVPVHKIASFEIVDIPLIQYMAATGKPLILSTGMATLEEISEAVSAARSSGASQLALLKCTSAYPAAPEDMNLSAIPDLVRRFNLPVGISDHTLQPTVAVCAVAVGACMVEKHLTLSRSGGGPDAAFSLEPQEFADLVRQVRIAERALGEAKYATAQSESGNRVFRRSLFVTADVREGEILTPQNVRCIRPAGGLHPRHLPDVLGKKALCDIARGTPLVWEMVDVAVLAGKA